MLRGIAHTFRLIHAARVLAQYEALIPEAYSSDVPGWAKFGASALRIGAPKKAEGVKAQGERLAQALQDLGPSYIKLGQFLATRPDIIGGDLADGLSVLQDRLPAFGMDEAQSILTREWGAVPETVFAEFSAPVAAASIAQVHKAVDADGKSWAVKVLRPGIEKSFAKDLSAFAFAARMAERLFPKSRRLRPKDAIATLKASVEGEMDLRMEAAAASELAENLAHDEFIRVPLINWPLTTKRVLVTEWIDGVNLRTRAGLEAVGQDPTAVAIALLQAMLTLSLRDGYFQADMHPGNLFIDGTGKLVLIDFGIMGRLNRHERRFMAETLFGLLTRDYKRVADVHFEIGYVPDHHSREDFALALRSVGERLFGRPASEISIADLLAQLFDITRSFDMEMQPSLMMTQKTIVVVEGVARNLDPNINMWTAAEPIMEKFVSSFVGPEARLREAADGMTHLSRLAARLPDTLESFEKAAVIVNDIAEGGGVKLHPDSARAIAEAEAQRTKGGRYALWVGAGALVAMAVAAIIGVSS